MLSFFTLLHCVQQTTLQHCLPHLFLSRSINFPLHFPLHFPLYFPLQCAGTGLYIYCSGQYALYIILLFQCNLIHMFNHDLFLTTCSFLHPRGFHQPTIDLGAWNRSTFIGMIIFSNVLTSLIYNVILNCSNNGADMLPVSFTTIYIYI